MQTLEMILLTKSSKHKGFCVAGIDFMTGNWVRLMSADTERAGAISERMLYDEVRGLPAQVLDRIRVNISRAVPTGIQPENVLVADPPRLRIVEKMQLQDVLNIHQLETRPNIFGCHSNILQADPESLRHSLEIILVENAYLYKQTTLTRRIAIKMDFDFYGKRYYTFSVTDPEYYPLNYPVEISRATLVLSIPDDEWSRQNGYFIFVSKIFSFVEYMPVFGYSDTGVGF